VNTLLWPDAMRAQFLPGAPGTHDDPALPTEEGDLEVIKSRYSGFVRTQLDSILQSLSVQTTVIFGLTTNVCVQSTVRDSWQHGYRTVTLSDCCSESNGGPFPLVSHEAALQSIARNFGIVCSSQDVVEAWDQSVVDGSVPSVRA
jgi:ureidoacrylate peracid hydrolase